MDETGFPGRPKTGFPPIVPKAKGFPGFMATFQKTISMPKSLQDIFDKIIIAYRNPC